MYDDPTFGDMLRRSPVEQAIAVFVPVLVAGGQLANTALAGLPLALSLPFAGVMIGFAVLMTQYNFAKFRRRELEAGIFETN